MFSLGREVCGLICDEALLPREACSRQEWATSFYEELTMLQLQLFTVPSSNEYFKR